MLCVSTEAASRPLPSPRQWPRPPSPRPLRFGLGLASTPLDGLRRLGPGGPGLDSFRRWRPLSTLAVPGRWSADLSSMCPRGTQGSGWHQLMLGGLGSPRFITRNIGGRLFYKRRPKMVPRWKFNWRSKWLEGAPHKKGVCTKVMVVNPKKPNAGLRKCAMVRLSNGRVVKVYIPGIGHNLQVHSVVMVRGGRRRDIIGCNLTAMRGHYDLLPVKNRKSSRSKYGVARPQTEPKRKRFGRLYTSVDRRLHFYKTDEIIAPDEKIPQRIPYTVRNNPPVTYRHKLKRNLKKQ